MNEIEQLKKQIADLEAEAAELKIVDLGNKTLLNGTFGKLFSRHSIFYAPEFGIAVTIGGQLSLLMLIERLELSGIRVVSANTDGVEMLVPNGYDGVANAIMRWWEQVTGLTLEDKSYLALYSRDVNNYISLQFDGSVKRKGVFGESGVLNNKHPDCDVCADAVVAFLTTGRPLRETVMGCTDVRKFLRVRGAKGGAVWFRSGIDSFALDGDDKSLVGGEYLGRAVRWYYARGSTDYIVDAGSLNKVAGSDGARPAMQLPDVMPADVDHDYYVELAYKMLMDAGYGKENLL